MCRSFTSKTIISYVTAKNIDVSSLHVTILLGLSFVRSLLACYCFDISALILALCPLCFFPRLVECRSPMWMIQRPSQLWPKSSFSTTSPPISPSGPLLYEACMLTTSSKYIRKQRGRGDILNDKKKTVIPYHSHHQRTKILPDFTCFKGEQKTKKKWRKRTSCYTEVLYLGT